MDFFGGAGLDPMNGPNRSAALDPMTGDRQQDAQTAEALRLVRARIDPDFVEGQLDTLTIPTPGAEVRWMAWSSWVRIEIGRAAIQSLLHVQGRKVLARTTAGGDQTLLEVAAISDELIRRQLLIVRGRAQARADRMSEMLAQASTLWPFWSAVAHIDAARTPRTFELFSALLTACSSILMQLKHEIGLPRPTDLLPALMPVLETPGHAAMPSGHAAAGFCFAEFAAHLMKLPGQDGLRQTLDRLAGNIADNRVVAGLHYPMDNVAGCAFGRALAACIAATVQPGQTYSGYTFNPPPEPIQVVLQDGADNRLPDLTPLGVTTLGGPAASTAPAILLHMWNLARGELTGLGMVRP